MNGFVQVERRILKECFYKDIPCKVLYLHLVLIAAYTDFEFAGHPLHSGQIWTSVRRLADETGLSVKEVRGGLDRLQRAHEIKVEGHRDGSLITLEKSMLFSQIQKPKGTPKGTQVGTYNKNNNYNNKYNKKPKNQFTNFTQRNRSSEDFKELERKLFEKGNKFSIIKENKSCDTQNSQSVE